MRPVHVAIISAGRVANTEPMSKIAPEAFWYVPDDEEADYERFLGPGKVIAAGPTLCGARNAALGVAFQQGRPCLQLSDDLRKIRYTDDGVTAREISLTEAVEICLAELERTGAKLAGGSPTDNLYWAKPTTSTDTFIVGDFHLVLPTDLRYDEALRLKEDYDYTLQHIAAYGGVARLNGLLLKFLHRTNRGGAVRYRTPEAEQEAIAHLKAKWPGRFRDNPRRPNEILMNKGAGAR